MMTGGDGKGQDGVVKLALKGKKVDFKAFTRTCCTEKLLCSQHVFWVSERPNLENSGDAS